MPNRLWLVGRRTGGRWRLLKVEIFLFISQGNFFEDTFLGFRVHFEVRHQNYMGQGRMKCEMPSEVNWCFILCSEKCPFSASWSFWNLDFGVKTPQVYVWVWFTSKFGGIPGCFHSLNETRSIDHLGGCVLNFLVEIWFQGPLSLGGYVGKIMSWHGQRFSDAYFRNLKSTASKKNRKNLKDSKVTFLEITAFRRRLPASQVASLRLLANELGTWIV